MPMPTNHPPKRLKAFNSGATKLLLVVAILAATWFVVLPWLAGQPQVNARLEWLAERKIDPSAMYYTELEAMEPILERLNRQERKPGQLVETPRR